MQEFPFWRLAAAIALGICVANALTWFAAETRLRYELREADEVSRRQEVIASAQRSAAGLVAADALAQQAQRTREAEQKWRDDRDGRYVQEAKADMPAGAVACLAHSVVIREVNGWRQVFDADGRTTKCRTVR